MGLLMFESETITNLVLLFTAVVLFFIMNWIFRKLKLKHVWSISIVLGAIFGMFIVMLLELSLSEGTLRNVLIGDTDFFAWPYTIQNLMWVVFSITIMFLVAEFILSKKDNNSSFKNLEQHIDGRLEPLRYLLWLTPTLGFLGTVIGMSLALSTLGNIDDFQAGINADVLKEVMMNLGTAFYTTILGLCLNMVTFGFYSVLVTNNKQLLAQR